MDILQISYFSKVYETTNYAHAAESLCVSRQGLRKVMRNLEREVGQPLFVNVANRLQPTEAAHRLYKASRAFVEGFRELEDAVAAMKFSQKTEVRLGAPTIPTMSSRRRNGALSGRTPPRNTT